MAVRVLPTPPGPVRVTSRTSLAAQERLDKPDLSFSAHKRRSRCRHGTGFSVALDRHGEDTGQSFPR